MTRERQILLVVQMDPTATEKCFRWLVKNLENISVDFWTKKSLLKLFRSLPMEQFFPSKPDTQAQVQLFIPSKHVALFLHVLG